MPGLYINIPGLGPPTVTCQPKVAGQVQIILLVILPPKGISKIAARAEPKDRENNIEPIINE